MKPYFEQDGITIFHGDCRDILPTLGPVDHVITSPPYGAIRQYGGIQPELWLDVIGMCADLVTEGGVVMWNTADQTIAGSETGDSFRQALHALDSGLLLHDTMIYCKEGVSFPDANRYHPAFEYMFVFSKGVPRHFNGLRDRVNKWAGSTVHGTRRQTDGSLTRPSQFGKVLPPEGLRWNWWVLPTASTEEAIDHPARMPIAMARAHIVTWSDPGETILDPFMGSGTTLRAAKDLGRKAIGIELEEKWCEVAAKRMSQSVLPLYEGWADNGWMVKSGYVEEPA